MTASNYADKIKEHWQILATIAISWSLFDLYQIYAPFGIDINNYVGVGELILLVFPSLFNTASSVFLLFCFFVFVMKKTEKNYSDKKVVMPDFFDLKYSIDEIRESISFKRKFRIFRFAFGVLTFTMSIGCICLIIGIIFFVVYLFISSNIHTYFPTGFIRLFTMFLFSMLVLLPISILLDLYFNNYANPVFSRFTTSNYPGIYLTIFFIICGIISNRMQFVNITNGYGTHKVSFEYKGQLVRTGADIVFIGATKDYVFLFNRKEKNSSAYSKDDVSFFKISSISYIGAYGKNESK